MADRIALGEGVEVSTDTKETQLNNNISVIGCTGSGKTKFVVEPRLLRTFDTNLILSDPKREIISKYAPLFRKRGYRVYELNLTSPQNGDCMLDPLQYVASDSDVNLLAQSLVNLCPQGENSSADVYWENSATNLAIFGILYVLATTDNPCFADFLDLMRDITIYDNSSLVTTSVDSVVDQIREQNPQHPLLEAYSSFKVTPVRTAGCIFSTLKTTLSNVFNQEIKEMFRTKSRLDVFTFTTQKSVLFITHSGNDTYVGAFVNLITELLINELSKLADMMPNQELPIPVDLILDDFACGTVIKSFPKQISKFRSKRISSTLILQSLSQLNTLYSEHEAKTIMNNCDTIIYLGGNDVDTAMDFARRLNAPLERVLYMPLDEMLIFRRGSKPIVTHRYKTFEDKDYIKLMSEYGKNHSIHEQRSDDLEVVNI